MEKLTWFEVLLTPILIGVTYWFGGWVRGMSFGSPISSDEIFHVMLGSLMTLCLLKIWG